MTDGSKQPLVTFALFGYNQEQFIQQAIDAVLAQEYDPLQIILSDDCSSDATYRIMQEAAARYEGAHQVIARQTPRNMGTLLHLADVARISSGELIVRADGDDISKPERTRTLVRAWKDSGAWGLCSRFDRISEVGEMLESAVKAEVIIRNGFGKYFFAHEGEVRVVIGCTSAYDSRAFKYLRLSGDDYILSEDGTMSVLLNLLGRPLVHIDDSLILYRENQGSSSNAPKHIKKSYADIQADEVKIERHASAQANRCKLFLRMNDYLAEDRARSINTVAVAHELRRQNIRATWSKTTFLKRLQYVVESIGSPVRKWAIPRIFGLKIFFLIKFVIRRIFRSRING